MQNIIEFVYSLLHIKLSDYHNPWTGNSVLNQPVFHDMTQDFERCDAIASPDCQRSWKPLVSWYHQPSCLYHMHNTLFKPWTPRLNCSFFLFFQLMYDYPYHDWDIVALGHHLGLTAKIRDPERFIAAWSMLILVNPVKHIKTPELSAFL